MRRYITKRKTLAQAICDTLGIDPGQVQEIDLKITPECTKVKLSCVDGPKTFDFDGLEGVVLKIRSQPDDLHGVKKPPKPKPLPEPLQ